LLGWAIICPGLSPSALKTDKRVAQTRDALKADH